MRSVRGYVYLTFRCDLDVQRKSRGSQRAEFFASNQRRVFGDAAQVSITKSQVGLVGVIFSRAVFNTRTRTT